MDDASEERFRQHEDMLQGLARMMAVQHGFNERVTLAIERLDASIARLEITQARIETLLARMIERSTNGRDA